MIGTNKKLPTGVRASSGQVVTDGAKHLWPIDIKEQSTSKTDRKTIAPQNLLKVAAHQTLIYIYFNINSAANNYYMA